MDIEKEVQSIENRFSINTWCEVCTKHRPLSKWCHQPIFFSIKWCFCGNVCDDNIENVVNDYQIDLMYKMLLLWNIGVFNINSANNSNDTAYVDEMKSLADTKSLYTIIANSDYIYGMNYQFSHCYLGKDMRGISQEKIIQCIGRVGRQDKKAFFLVITSLIPFLVFN